MNTNMHSKIKGFTLIEMMLVLVIVSMLIYMVAGYFQQKTLSTRIDRTSLQMQQILNAGLSYYVANGYWPNDLACLQGTSSAANKGQNCATPYLPTPLNSPWGKTYTVNVTTAQFYVSVPIAQGSAGTGSAAAVANIIAGQLPLAYSTAKAGTTTAPPVAGTACAKATATCYVVGSVNIPGQNLNNATAVNFAGLFRHGGCVPVPVCPVDAKGVTMTPEIIVVPSSISGVNGNAQVATYDTSKYNYSPSNVNTTVYPITSFTAYATPSGVPTTTTPPVCNGGGSANNSCTSLDGSRAAKAYWRVCVQIVTEAGSITDTRSDRWGNNVAVAAFTRCAITNETAGTGFSVYSN